MAAETTRLEGTVDRIGPVQVRVLLDDGGTAFVPRGLIPMSAGRRLRVGARMSVSIRRHGEDATEEWEIAVLPDRPAPSGSGPAAGRR